MRTYENRRFRDNLEWSNDPISAARLGLGSEVAARIAADIDQYQVYSAGFGSWDTSSFTQPYIENLGIIAAAINEAVGTGFDGIIRLAPALPNDWSVSGTVYVHGQTKLHVHFERGELVFGVLESGSTKTVEIRNPWRGIEATVVDSAGEEVATPTSGDTLTADVQAGGSYLIKRSSDAIPSLIEVTGTAATGVKTHGTRMLGVQ
jgi:hypothetical protein